MKRLLLRLILIPIARVFGYRYNPITNCFIGKCNPIFSHLIDYGYLHNNDEIKQRIENEESLYPLIIDKKDTDKENTI